MFTINDYPAHDIVSGQVTKGYKGCACCGPNNICRRSKVLGKNVSDNQHRCTFHYRIPCVEMKCSLEDRRSTKWHLLERQERGIRDTARNGRSGFVKGGSEALKMTLCKDMVLKN